MLRILVAAVSAWFAIASTGLAEDVTIEVRRDGKPVAGATVRFILWDWKGDFGDRTPVVRILRTATTDAAGRVTTTPDAEHGVYVVIADDAGNVGWFSVAGHRIAALSGNGGAKIVELRPSVVHEGRLSDDRGSPIVGVKLTVPAFMQWTKTDDVRERDLSLVFLPESLGLYSTTDAAGKFRIAGLPPELAFDLVFTTPAHGRCRLARTAKDNGDITLPAPGSIKVSIESDAGPIAVKDVSLELVPSFSDGAHRPDLLPTIRTDEWKADGGSGPILPGKYQLRFTAKSAYFIEPLPPFDIAAGTVKEVRLKAVKQAEITGRIVETGTDKGLPGVRFNFRSRETDGSKMQFVSGATDADGRYRVFVPGGRSYTFAFDRSIASGDRVFLQPPYDRAKGGFAPPVEVPVGGKAECKTLEITEALSVRGKVIDANDQSIAGPFTVYCPTQATDPFEPSKPFLNAAFTLPGLPTDLPLTFRIRQGQAVNVPEAIDPTKLKEPLTFRITEANGVRIVGTVLDVRGKPVLEPRCRYRGAMI